MIRVHRDAVEGLLTGAGLTVHNVTAPNGATKYVGLHHDQGTPQIASYAGVSSWRAWRFVTHAVGATDEQALWLAEKAEAALLDVRPTVEGRVTSPIRKETPQMVTADNDQTPPVFVAIDVWAYTSTPA